MTLDEAIELDHAFRDRGGSDSAAFVLTFDEWQSVVNDIWGSSVTIHPSSTAGDQLLGRAVWIAENLAAPPVNSVCTAAARAALDRR